jgi:hypothetical protein
MRLHFWARFGCLLLSVFWPVCLHYPGLPCPPRLVSMLHSPVLPGNLRGGRLLKPVTSYPFSLGWSDGNRLWDYSILFCL